MPRDIVDRKPTPATIEELRTALRSAAAAKDLPLGPETEALILAHIALENDRGRALIQHNVGNLFANSEWEGDAWRPPWFAPPGPDDPPILHQRHKQMKEGKVPSAFRAYANLAEGMRHYVGLLHRNGLWDMAARGPRAYSEHVVTSRFCPDCNPDRLSRSLESMQEEFLRIPGGAPAAASGINPYVAAGVVAVGGYALWQWLKPDDEF